MATLVDAYKSACADLVRFVELYTGEDWRLDLPTEDAFIDALDGFRLALTSRLINAKPKASEVALKAGPTLATRLAIEYAQTRAGKFVRRLSKEQRDVLRDAIADGIRSRASMASIAKSLKDVVGLTSVQARQLKKLERDLKASGMAPSKIAKAVEARRKKSIMVRARAIARTEVVSAKEQAKLNAWAIQQSEGKLDGSVGRKWNTRDPCARCLALGLLPPVPIGQPFSGGIDAPPLHTNCKCYVTLVKIKAK